MNGRVIYSLCPMNARISRANVRDCLFEKETKKTKYKTLFEKKTKNYKAQNESPKKMYISIYATNVSVSYPRRMTA